MRPLSRYQRKAARRALKKRLAQDRRQRAKHCPVCGGPLPCEACLTELRCAA